GRLAAAGRPDERRDLVLADVQRDAAHGLDVAVPDAEVADLEHHRPRAGVDRARPGERPGQHRAGAAAGRRGVGGGGGGGGLGHVDVILSTRFQRAMATVWTRRTRANTARVAAVEWAALNSCSGSFAQWLTIVGRATKRSVRCPGSTTLDTLRPAPRLRKPVTAPT